MIEIDQYKIDSDGSQYILREKKRHPADHEKTPGKEYMGQPAFYSTFENCIKSVLNNELMRLTSLDGYSLAAIRSKLDNFGANVQNQVIKALIKQSGDDIRS